MLILSPPPPTKHYWSQGGPDSLQRRIRQGYRLRGIPGNQGGPLMHVIAAKATCFQEEASLLSLTTKSR